LRARARDDKLGEMRCAFLVVLSAAVGCATTHVEPTSTPPGHVTIPAWVEGPVDEGGPTAPATTIAPPPTFVTKTLGDAPFTSSAKKKYSGRRIDLDLVNADVHEVCRLLADVGKINIVVADDVKGSVTIKMKQVPWDQALDAILRAKGFASERDGNVVTVYVP
jgi:hypothetical protein